MIHKMKEMKILIVLILSFLTSISSPIAAQVDSIEFKQFKTYLPYIMKAIKKNSESLSVKEEKIQDEEYIPIWELKNFTQKEIVSMLNNLENKSKMSIDSLAKTYDEINIICNLPDFNAQPKLKQEFRNLSIEISAFNINNEDSENIYFDSIHNAFQPKINDRQQVIMQGSQFNALIPIRENYSAVYGDIILTIKEKQDYSYKRITTKDIGIQFEMNDIEIECLSINGYRAMFKINQKNDRLEFTSINSEGKKHVQNAASYIPTKVYYKSIEKNLTEEEIKSFASNYSYEDFIDKNQSYILTYESSGNISELHFFIAKETKERGSCNLKIKL